MRRRSAPGSPLPHHDAAVDLAREPHLGFDDRVAVGLLGVEHRAELVIASLRPRSPRPCSPIRRLARCPPAGEILAVENRRQRRGGRRLRTRRKGTLHRGDALSSGRRRNASCESSGRWKPCRRDRSMPWIPVGEALLRGVGAAGTMGERFPNHPAQPMSQILTFSRLSRFGRAVDSYCRVAATVPPRWSRTPISPGLAGHRHDRGAIRHPPASACSRWPMRATSPPRPAGPQSPHAGRAAADVDLVVLGTFTPDMCIPSTACTVQEKHRASMRPAMDVTAACRRLRRRASVSGPSSSDAGSGRLPALRRHGLVSFAGVRLAFGRVRIGMQGLAWLVRPAGRPRGHRPGPERRGRLPLAGQRGRARRLGSPRAGRGPARRLRRPRGRAPAMPDERLAQPVTPSEQGGDNPCGMDGLGRRSTGPSGLAEDSVRQVARSASAPAARRDRPVRASIRPTPGSSKAARARPSAFADRPRWPSTSTATATRPAARFRSLDEACAPACAGPGEHDRGPRFGGGSAGPAPREPRGCRRSRHAQLASPVRCSPHVRRWRLAEWRAPALRLTVARFTAPWALFHRSDLRLRHPGLRGSRTPG